MLSKTAQDILDELENQGICQTESASRLYSNSFRSQKKSSKPHARNWWKSDVSSGRNTRADTQPLPIGTIKSRGEPGNRRKAH